MSLDPESTTDDVLGDVDLSGRRIVVTGASSGLGEETSRALAARGASITMAARNAEKNAAAVGRIRTDNANADLETRELDLADLSSVRRFAEGYLADHDSIDVLVNNAGVMVCPLARTADGFETQFGTNHLGHFLLTVLLADALARGEAPRVVTLSSGAHLISDVDLEDPNFERTEYDEWLAYGRSKSANALFALELAKRMGDCGVLSYSVHPGMVATELGRHLDEELMNKMMARMAERMKDRAATGEAPQMPTMRVPAVGAATQVWAATAPELVPHSGAYLFDCRVGDGPDVAEYILDEDRSAQLWALSEDLVGVNAS